MNKKMRRKLQTRLQQLKELYSQILKKIDEYENTLNKMRQDALIVQGRIIEVEDILREG
ncbi:MAG: hypothetical protein ACTSV7_09245 [Candidatus Baldrarchaeia archaeon]